MSNAAKSFLEAHVKTLRKVFIGAGLALAVTSAAQASGTFTGATSAASDIKTIATAAGGILGGVVTLIGGGITAFKAAHGEDFTKPLIMAIVAAAVAAVSVVSM